MHIFSADNILSALLHGHIQTGKYFGIFRKSHVQQEAALSEPPKVHGKNKSNQLMEKY